MNLFKRRSGPAWAQELLVWLRDQGAVTESFLVRPHGSESRGHELVAIRDLMPDEEICRLPEKVLLNRYSLIEAGLLLKGMNDVVIRDLSAIQFMSLVLSHNRPPSQESSKAKENAKLKANSKEKQKEKDEEDEDEESHDVNEDADGSSNREPYGAKTIMFTLSSYSPYFASLPNSFDTIPLWISHSEMYDDEYKEIYAEIQKGFSPKLKSKAQNLVKRYEDDLTCVKELLERIKSERLISFDQEDFLWGWLIINTRSLYYNLNEKDEKDNFTLCPYIDLANHIPESMSRVRASSQGGFTFLNSGSSSSSSPSSSTSKNEIVCKKGQPVTFSYGGHDDETLIVEYGFSLGWDENVYNAVEVTDVVNSRFDEERLEVLRFHGYGSGYVIERDKKENSFGASYNLLLALRLLNTNLSDDSQMSTWESHVQGLQEGVSEEVETKVGESWAAIAGEIVDRAKNALDELDGNPKLQGVDGSLGLLLGWVRRLWLETLEAASISAVTL